MRVVVLTTIRDKPVEVLEKTFEALASQTVRPDKVLVVNDGSSIDYQKLQDQFPWFTWDRRESDAWRTPVAACNYGLRQIARNDIVFLLSADVILPAHAIEFGLAYIEETDGIFCGTIIDSATGHVFCGSGRIFPSPWFIGCRKQWIHDIEGFDENFGKGIAYDDNDFSGRLLLENGKLWISNEVQCVHQSHPNSWDAPGGQEKVEVNRQYIYKKWEATAAPFGDGAIVLGPCKPPLLFQVKQRKGGVLVHSPRHIKTH